MKLIQIGVDKFTRKPIYKELTYDFFIKHIGWEWTFYYKDNLIEISVGQAKDGSKDSIYSLVLNSNSDGNIQEFYSEQDFIANAKVFGRSLQDIWDELDYNDY